MRALLIELLGRGALGALLTWLAWRALGAVGLVWVAPLWALLLARPLRDALAGSWRHTTRLATRHALHGTRHYRGHTLGVIEDAEHRWWLNEADLRHIVPGLPDTTRLLAATRGRHLPPRGLQPAHVQAEALAELLAASQSRPTLQFLAWLRQTQAAEQRRRERGTPP